MNKNFKKVSADTTVEQLSQWLEEGRLYVAPSSDELIDRAVGEVVRCVRRIDDRSARTREDMSIIWVQILSIMSIRQRLLLQKGNRKNTTNWYFVASIVNYLLVRMVYEGTIRGLTLQMHGGVDRHYDNNITRYPLSPTEENAIRQILASINV